MPVSITFDGESSESFANALQHFKGYTVEVTPNAEDDPAGRSESFDAVLLGSASDVTGDYFGVLVRSYDDEAGEGVGEPFAVIVRDLRIY